MLKFNKSHIVDDMYFTSFKGIYLNTPISKLFKLLNGVSIEGSFDNKTQGTWIYKKDGDENNKSQIITIYDYKNEKSFENNMCWHIGGKNITQKEIKKFLIHKGFNENEIEIKTSPLYK